MKNCLTCKYFCDKSVELYKDMYCTFEIPKHIWNALPAVVQAHSITMDDKGSPYTMATDGYLDQEITDCPAYAEKGE